MELCMKATELLPSLIEISSLLEIDPQYIKASVDVDGRVTDFYIQFEDDISWYSITVTPIVAHCDFHRFAKIIADWERLAVLCEALGILQRHQG